MLFATKLRDEWKLIFLRYDQQRMKRIIQVFQIAHDYRVPEEVLEESQVAPGLFRQRVTGERFVMENNKLIPV